MVRTIEFDKLPLLSICKALGEEKAYLLKVSPWSADLFRMKDRPNAVNLSTGYVIHMEPTRQVLSLGSLQEYSDEQMFWVNSMINVLRAPWKLKQIIGLTTDEEGS